MLTVGAGLYLVYVLATQMLVLPPVLAFMVAPQRSAAPRSKVQRWLQGNNRVIVMILSFLFGAWSLFKGVGALLAVTM